MNQNLGWELEITVDDVFRFEGGRTVFVGEVKQGPNYISSCDCELLLGDTCVAKIRLEGEMIPLKKTRMSLRAVSTLDTVDVDRIRGFKGRCRLVRR
jgi:hypothetical protein